MDCTQCLAQRAEAESGLNTKSNICLAQRTKSQLQYARDVIPIVTFYQWYLCDTKGSVTTNIGIVQNKIPMGEMYHRYLQGRNEDALHQ